MLKIEINNKKYTLYTNFEEITIKRLHKAYEYLELVRPEVLEYLKPVKEGEKEKEIDKEIFLDFQINWIALFCDVPISVLKMIQPFEGVGLSIQNIYSFMKKFIYTPEKYYDIKKFSVKNKEYNLVEDLETITGAKIYFSSGSYNQFKLSNMLVKQVEGDKRGAVSYSLRQLAAVLYTHNGDNSNEAIKKKIEDFEELDAATCWSCYFFFAKLQSKWKDFFLSYMGKTTPRKQAKARTLEAREKLRKVFKETIFGKLSNSKLQNSGFSIMDWKE